MSYSGSIDTSLPANLRSTLGVLALSTLAGGADMVGSVISNLGAPSLGTDAATVTYVDDQVAPIKGSGHPPVVLATNAALAAVTATDTTLTANASGALSIDGTPAVLGARVLVKNQAAPNQNGIYTVTDAGSVATFFILTRAVDAVLANQFTLDHGVTVTSGSVNVSTSWVNIAPLPVSVGEFGSGIVFAKSVVPSQDSFTAETITAATVGPILSRFARIHIATDGDAGDNVSSATALAGLVGDRHVFLAGDGLIVGAVWKIDFGADNFLDATGTPKQFINLTLGQSATLISLGNGKWMNANAGFSAT